MFLITNEYFNELTRILPKMKPNLRISLWLVMMLGLLIVEVRAQSLLRVDPTINMSLPAQGNVPDELPIVVDPASRVWLTGSANIVDFQCVAGIIESIGTISGIDTSRSHSGPHGKVTLEVKIPISKLNCGKPGINRDMKKTLNSDEHPFITYRLDENKSHRTSAQSSTNSFFKIETDGDLIISGFKRAETIKLDGQFIGAWQFRVKGQHSVLMSDYELDPPTPLMGLIKVNDELIVHFDVIFTLK